MNFSKCGNIKDWGCYHNWWCSLLHAMQSGDWFMFGHSIMHEIASNPPPPPPIIWPILKTKPPSKLYNLLPNVVVMTDCEKTLRNGCLKCYILENLVVQIYLDGLHITNVPTSVLHHVCIMLTFCVYLCTVWQSTRQTCITSTPIIHTKIFRTPPVINDCSLS